jgi:hypothetical protein
MISTGPPLRPLWKSKNTGEATIQNRLVNLPFGDANGFRPLSARFGMPIRRVTRILFSLCSDLETDVIGESVQRGFDADIKLIERRQLLLW